MFLTVLLAAAAAQGASPSSVPTASPSCGVPPLVSYAAVFGVPIADTPILRFVRLLATADAATQTAALVATREPVDPATAATVDAAVAKITCAADIAADAAKRMGSAISQYWNVPDDAVAGRLEAGIEIVARALAARTTLDEVTENALLAPFGTTLAALNAVPASASASATAPCNVPNAEARTIKVARPVYPPSAMAAAATGRVFLKVDLDTDGDVVRVARSGPPPGDDAAAAALVEESLRAAAVTVYAPGIRACKGEAGTYIFRAEFRAR